MTNMQRGFKSKLDPAINTSQGIDVQISINGNSQYDFSCFGLSPVGSEEKVTDDRYFIFFNQERSPNNEITMSTSGSTANFVLNLPSLPPQISKLSFTANIDGSGTMHDIRSCTVKINQNGQTAFQLDMSGSEFTSQKAIIAIEIYKKDVWRIAAIGNGFAGGLPDLLKLYGVEEGDPGAQPSPPPPPPPSAPSGGPMPTPTPPPAPPPPPSPARTLVNGHVVIEGEDFGPPRDEDWV